jgi:hypothetical protein
MKNFEQIITKLNEELDKSIELIPHYSKETNPQLAIGIKVEEEHKDLYNFFRNFCKVNGLKMPITEERFYEIIALAHLREIKDYYTRLKNMENSAKQPNK